MSGWDALRARQRGDRREPAPRCARCDRVRVFNPCRDCATPAELARIRETTSGGRPIVVPWYPPLDESP